jgi:hypothetical protein
MTHEEAAKELAHECPRRILDLLHARGIYIHCTSDRFPGKILCFHKDTPRPDDWAPTAAQAALWDASEGQHPPAAHG